MMIPDSALSLIKLQRSGYKNHKEDFIKDMQKEFFEIKQYLPIECNSMLDIGCGLAVMDILISNHYGKSIKINLADKSKIETNILYGFRPKTSFYNSFDVVEEIYKMNNITNYSLINSEKGEDIKDIGKQDLIISLLSCGYHYPVTTYLDRIVELLSENGKLIIDIRDWTEGIEIVENELPNVEVISHYNKSYRICAGRN